MRSGPAGQDLACPNSGAGRSAVCTPDHHGTAQDSRETRRPRRRYRSLLSVSGIGQVPGLKAYGRRSTSSSADVSFLQPCPSQCVAFFSVSPLGRDSAAATLPDDRRPLTTQTPLRCRRRTQLPSFVARPHSPPLSGADRGWGQLNAPPQQEGVTEDEAFRPQPPQRVKGQNVQRGTMWETRQEKNY